MLRLLSRILACLASALVARADVTLAPLFQDHAVLQCDQPVPVWGRADPGEAATVAFGGQRVRTAAGSDGRWVVRLAPLVASTRPVDLVATGKNTVRVTDVLGGEV